MNFTSRRGTWEQISQRKEMSTMQHSERWNLKSKRRNWHGGKKKSLPCSEKCKYNVPSKLHQWTPPEGWSSLNPWSANIHMHILLTILHIFLMLLVERIILIKHQHVLRLVIIYYILMTHIFDQLVILSGEISCLSLLGLKGLRGHLIVMPATQTLHFYPHKKTPLRFRCLHICNRLH